MHIKQIELKNIRGIEKLRVKFDKPAGWHVFIGDNGSGKSTLLRAIALGLLGEEGGQWLRVLWTEYIRHGQKTGKITITLNKKKAKDAKLDLRSTEWSLSINRVSDNLSKRSYNIIDTRVKIIDPEKSYTGELLKYPVFATSFGPHRRLTYTKSEYDSTDPSAGDAGAHVSLFDDSFTLKGNINFLMDLHFARLEEKEEEIKLLSAIELFITHSELLPKGTEFDRISSEGVFLKQGRQEVSVLEMSDGVRTTLGLVLEIIRQQVSFAGRDKITKALEKPGINTFPGIVIIDEVALHLHPSWQTRIGKWFTNCFPKTQFIVTTHSPLICRAAEHGSIWQMSPPYSDAPIKKIVGIERDRLIFGNILDAYGTQLFGENTTSSDTSTDMREDLADLHQKMLDGIITDEERDRMFELRSIMPTENVDA